MRWCCFLLFVVVSSLQPKLASWLVGHVGVTETGSFVDQAASLSFYSSSSSSTYTMARIAPRPSLVFARGLVAAAIDRGRRR